MIEPIQVTWSPVGVALQSLGARALVDVTDGDTPNIRMPIRMLSVDTPEVTARSEARAGEIDEEFQQLAVWIRQGRAPISAQLGEVVASKLATGKAGTLQLQQGREASAFAKDNMQRRLTRPNGRKRNLFTRIVSPPFDHNGRLLAYVAPDYSVTERRALTRRERATFNLDLVAAGWAVPFVLYPAIPGEFDLPLLIEAAVDAATARRGIWASDETLPAYEYRAMEKLYRITKKIVEGVDLRAGEAYSWRERYCADLRTRALHGPEGYSDIPPPYRLWIWPGDVTEAVGRLNLIPAPRLAGAT